MKVTLNQTNLNIYSPLTRKNRNYYVKSSAPKNVEYSTLPNYNLAMVPSNVSFKANPSMEFLLAQSERLRCAYSGKIMLSPSEFKTISQKLLKRPNAQSAINLLQSYEVYMHDIESIIFDILKEASHKNKRGFNDILKEEAPDALIRLKEKQKNILTKTDKIIDTMSEPIAEQVRLIRDEALEKMENDTFGRKSPLEKIKRVKAEGKDLEKIIKIYQSWYKLPSSSKDLDAFIVKYSKYDHDDIAKRLVSSSVATVEHVKPQARNGSDGMNNLLLVSAQFNNGRDTMPLNEYIKLNPEIDIEKNLQRYIDDVIAQVNDSRTPFSKKPSYPMAIVDTILEETKGAVILNTDNLQIPQSLAKQDEILTKRLEQKYKVRRRN